MQHRLLLGLGGFLIAWGALAVSATADEHDEVARELFERHVRPVLVESCVKCHGPNKQEGSLRVDSREALLRGGDRGVAVTPSDPKQSLLLTAVRQSDDLAMPPDSKLTDAQIAALERWVELGAPWPDPTPLAVAAPDPARTHWAFQPVRDPPVPADPFANEPGGNPIDAFVRSRLAAEGLSPSPRADRRTLIRRATFDLTGLPPTPEEVEAFVNDDDPQAYERLIDRLLESPHYGEHWGRYWLDVARYSDAKGYVYAREHRFWVHAWSYRDWVVKALNDDMPYDRFLLLQLAADQAAPNEPEHLAAMGFLTLGRRFLGVTHDIIDDRIDVVTRGAMGLTVACARCHDHKYDPIPTRDYYSLYGVFQNCAEQLVPVAKPDKEDDDYRAFEAELHKRQQRLATTLAQRRAETAARVRARLTEYLMAQRELHKYPEEGFDQILEKDDLLPAFVRRWRSFLARAESERNPIFIPWFAYAPLKDDEFASRTAEVTAALAKLPAGAVHPWVAEKFMQPPQSPQEVAQRYGELFAEVDRQWQATLQAAAEKQLPPPTALDDANAESLRQVLYGPAAPCEVPDESIVNIEFYFDSNTCNELWKLQGDVDRWLIDTPQAPAHAVILVDRTPTTPAYVFKRGRPSNLGEIAPRQFLQLLAGPERKPFEHGSGRLELAQAIIDPSNPLTARVAVNRVWMHHFGAGLVTTPSDFGVRSTPPSHPDLLDWLTRRFIEDGWRLKPLHRRIMLSETYQQASVYPQAPGNGGQTTGTGEPARRDPHLVDPENRLLWRMNQRKLTFEELRDAMFAVTGELDLSLGGKPADLFSNSFRRRTLYGLIDRQFLPSTLRVFDFANPDLHIPQRSDTTVPQQALFFLNHELPLNRAQALAACVPADLPPEERVQQMYRRVFQRSATPKQVAAALALVQAKVEEPEPVPPQTADWQYGFGGYDEATQRTTGFEKLPHFTGSAWQGGPAWPDAKLGWVQLTASGGHAGNDLQHAAIRRWTAPRTMTVNVRSTLIHDTPQGDGVRGRLISSRHGLLATATVHNSRADLHADAIEVQAGDTLDFALDIGGTLNNDQFTWEATITPVSADSSESAWNSQADFAGPVVTRLAPWEQLAQVLLSTNEFMFID